MMNIIVLDSASIRERGVMPTFSIKNGLIHRNINDSFPMFKFIVLPIDNQTLVIAPTTDHGELYALHLSWNMPSDESVKEQIRGFSSYDIPLCDCPIIGAGAVDIESKVTSWKSSGFRINTPEFLRRNIEEEITRLHRAGKLVV